MAPNSLIDQELQQQINYSNRVPKSPIITAVGSAVDAEELHEELKENEIMEQELIP